LRSARAPRVLLVPLFMLVSLEVEPEPIVDDEEPDVPEFMLEPDVPEFVDDPVLEPVEPVPIDDEEPVEPLVLGLAEPLVPGLVELPEPMLPLVVLLVVEPAPPPALPLLPPEEALPLVPAPPPVLPAAELPDVPPAPLVPCATTMPVPRANATAAAIVNMRGCLLMMSVLLQVQESDRGCDRFAR
jgi:hypothetical protein